MTRGRREPKPSLSADGLDAVLRDWRRRQDAATDDAALTARVTAAIHDDAALAVPPPPRPRDRWAERTAWFAAGIAASLVAVVALRPRSSGGDTDWPPSVRFAAGQIAEKAALMAGMEETFADGLAWVAEHDRRVEVGLVPGQPRTGGDHVAVRIVVLSRREGETAWSPIWQSEVVTRDEQVVDVATGPTGAGRLRLWTHPLPDGAIAVDGELALVDAAVPLRTSYGGVQQPGEPRRVTGDRIGDVEWQVIQTVVPLGPRDAATKEVG